MSKPPSDCRSYQIGINQQVNSIPGQDMKGTTHDERKVKAGIFTEQRVVKFG